MAGCSALGKARIEVGILVKIGWLGSPKMSVPGIAPNGKPRPWLDRSRPGKSKNAIFGQKTVVFGLFFAIFYYLGVPPGGPHPGLCCTVPVWCRQGEPGRCEAREVLLSASCGTGATKIKKNRGGPPRGNPQIMGNGQE